MIWQIHTLLEAQVKNLVKRSMVLYTVHGQRAEAQCVTFSEGDSYSSGPHTYTGKCQQSLPVSLPHLLQLPSQNLPASIRRSDPRTVVVTHRQSVVPSPLPHGSQIPNNGIHKWATWEASRGTGSLTRVWVLPLSSTQECQMLGSWCLGRAYYPPEKHRSVI